MPDQKDMPEQADKARLDVLIQDYSMARDDERSYLTVLAAMFGVVITLLGLLVAVASSACDFRTERTQCFDIPRPALAALPLLPLATMAYIQITSSLATLRSYYLRGVEREIRSIAGSPIEALPGVLSSSYFDFIQTLVSLRRGRIGIRISGLIVLCSIMVIFGGFTFIVAMKMPLPYRAAMAFVYIPLVLILLKEAMSATIGGRSLFAKVLHRYVADPGERLFTSSPQTTGRGIGSYLVFPRPEDWHKWLFLPCAFGFGLLCSGRLPSNDTLMELMIAILVVEYLVYQGRYQWNDIRGLDEDLVHPESGARKRLPITHDDARGSVGKSTWLIAMRQSLAITAIVWMFYAGHGETGWILTTAMAAVWLTAIGYEALRSRKSTVNLTRMTRGSLCLVVLVGCGYAVRLFVGFGISGISPLEQPIAWTLVAAAWAFGVMFVSITWALEGLAHVNQIDDKYYYATGGSTGQPGLPLLSRKPHLGAMLSFLKIDVHFRGHLTKTEAPLCVNLKPFTESGGSLLAPWNLGLIMSTALGVMFNVGFFQLSWQVGLVVFIAALAATLVVIKMRIGIGYWFIFGGSVLVLGMISLTSGVLCLAFVLMYTLFRSNSYHSLKNPFEEIAKSLRSVRSKLFVLFVGKQTASLVNNCDPMQPPD
ncbi:hypothetical protein L3Q67_26215 [Saccharothrix sp. AJ9571]|nr:hypothetical protein L3Q67_26215 [Saccharothrix sp. AJ9571]